MNEKSAEIITRAVNVLKENGMNPVEIAIDFTGAMIPVLLNAVGPDETADYFDKLAAKVRSCEKVSIN